MIAAPGDGNQDQYLMPILGTVSVTYHPAPVLRYGIFTLEEVLIPDPKLIFGYP